MTQEPATTLARDERGTILVFFGILLGVILGFVALSFDIGRAGITRSELQSFADSVALAAAGELDGTDDAITRATNAAALILDTQSYGNTDRELQGAVSYALTFYATLPTSDLAPMAGATTDPARAAYVQVSVTPTVVESTFGAAFAALTGQPNRDFNLGANAVAGLSIMACDITPMMFCLPNANYRAEENIGDMILLRSGRQGAAWGPGDFGFLDPSGIGVDPAGPCAGLRGANLKICQIAAVDNITQCFDQRGVDLEPGQKNGTHEAMFNVRFDIYRSSLNGERNDPNYAPAPNVVKGLLPNGQGCFGNNATQSTTSRPLPRDTCFANGTCSRIGDGNWSAGRTPYVNWNYGTPPGTPGTVDPHSMATTRYAYYLAELAAAGSGPILNRAETGRPTCSPHMAGPDRRIITVAGIDCAANNIQGSANNVPVQEFFKIFLTEPVGQTGTNPPSFDMYGEVVGSASEEGTGAVGTGGIVRDVVQLYR